MENLRDAPKTRVHEGSFLGRSMGIWHLVFQTGQKSLVPTPTRSDPSSLGPAPSRVGGDHVRSQRATPPTTGRQRR